MKTNDLKALPEDPALQEGTVSAIDLSWSQILLRDGQSAPDECVAELHAFIARALFRTFGQRGDCGDAFIEDMTQDSVLRVLQNLHLFKGESKFTTWVTTLCMRVAFTELRRARWKDVSLSQLLAADEGAGIFQLQPSSAAGSTETDTARRDIIDALKMVIANNLTKRQRTAIEADLAGMPSQEVARQLNINTNALYKLVHDARKKLKLGLFRFGITEQDVRAVIDA